MSTKHMNLRPALLILLAVALLSYACTRVEDNARSGSLLTISTVTGTAGGNGGAANTAPMLSDTCDNDNGAPQDPELCSVFNDNANVSFANDFLAIGPTATGQAPTFMNDVIVNRYRVDYFRPNGRNTPGVDVPFGIDGTMNLRVAIGGTSSGSIIVVRHEAKHESPLYELDNGSSEGVLTVNAQLHFWGNDISGRVVDAIGYLEIHFANFAEP